MTHEEAKQLLIDKGFENGWSLTDDQLVLWEHEENPPKPLTRPK
jgi:hypothetical protein